VCHLVATKDLARLYRCTTVIKDVNRIVKEI